MKQMSGSIDQFCKIVTIGTQKDNSKEENSEELFPLGLWLHHESYFLKYSLVE